MSDSHSAPQGRPAAASEASPDAVSSEEGDKGVGVGRLASRLCRVDVRSVVGPPEPVRRAQGLLRRKRLKVDIIEDVGQPPVKLKCCGRAGGGRLLEETPRTVAEHLHHSPGPLRPRRVHLCRRSFKPDPDGHDGGDQISGARRWIHMGQKLLLLLEKLAGWLRED